MRYGRDRQIAALAELARGWLEGRIAAERLDALAQFVGQTLAGIGEAAVCMMLTTPQDWSSEALGATLGEMAVNGYSSLVQT